MSGPKRIAVLGSSGSVGRKAVEIARRYPDRFRVTALSVHDSVEVAAEQAAAVKPDTVVVSNPERLAELKAAVSGARVEAGPDAMAALAASPDVDLVVNAVVGRAGLEASLAAAETGKQLALANKESLVLAGELLMATARRTGARVLPIDSEHSGLFQVLEERGLESVARLIITASGGPFRGKTAEELRAVTPEAALNHPVWPMGPRITIDSATLINKGLEVIETHYLFGIPLDQVAVWVHPQSVVHALVEFADRSILAQLSHPDMMLPIQYAMTYPDRLACETPRLDLAEWGTLDFEAPDRDTFPGLGLAYEAASMGGTAPAVLNAADEVAVDAFLNRRIAFPQITETVGRVLRDIPVRPVDGLRAVDASDREARARARELVGG